MLVYPHIAVYSTGFYPSNEEVERFLNKESLDAMYPCLKVDPSGFSKSVQEELRQIELANRTKLSEEMQSNLMSLKEQQIAKLMRAYQLIKEATELLDGIQSTIDFEPIKLENMCSVIFKNGGNITEKGCIEFEDFFKNNMVLRMLDLSTLDLVDVDIRGMDFSGTNVHIDPQKIYNKDMTDVNATGLKFSPFTDSFEGVILNGTVITDKEANIDLNTVAKYDSRTIIKKDNIMIM